MEKINQFIVGLVAFGIVYFYGILIAIPVILVLMWIGWLNAVTFYSYFVILTLFALGIVTKPDDPSIY